MPIKEFSNSVIILDDVGVVSDKKTREAVYSLLNRALETGRHFKTFCLLTNHLPSNRPDTRRIECHVFVHLPPSSSSKIEYVLIEHLGLDKKQIKDFKKQNS